MTAFFKHVKESHMEGKPLLSGFAFSHLSTTVIFPLMEVQMVHIGFCYKERTEILAVMTLVGMETCFI